MSGRNTDRNSRSTARRPSSTRRRHDALSASRSPSASSGCSGSSGCCCAKRPRGASLDPLHADDAAAGRPTAASPTRSTAACSWSGVGTLIGTPVGILAGTYLAEYGSAAGSRAATRFINDVLLSAPSIVIGLFVYAVYVAQVGHFSGWAGVDRARAHRDPGGRAHHRRHAEARARTACARPRWRSAPHVEGDPLVTCRAARAGIVTGVLLAVARITGETAPLLFTALNNQFWSART